MSICLAGMERNRYLRTSRKGKVSEATVIAYLRKHYSEISKHCRENKEAVIITVNGRGDTVSLAYEEYKRMKARIELLEILTEAEDDVTHFSR